MSYGITSNRGMTGFPQQYVSAWQQYGQGPDSTQQWVQHSQNKAWNDAAQQQQQSLFSMFPNLFGGGGSRGYAPATGRGGSGAARGSRVGPSSFNTDLPPAGSAYYRNWNYSNVPPATNQPQVPVGGGGGGGSGGGGGAGGGGVGAQLQEMLANYQNPITAGKLDQGVIDQALATVNAGAPAWAAQKYGGNFSDNATQDLQRASINLSRAASEQQASMDLAHQRAKAGAGLDISGLMQQLNSQNVTSGLNQQEAILRAILGMFGGLI